MQPAKLAKETAALQTRRRVLHPMLRSQRRLSGCELQRYRQPGRRDEGDEEVQRVVLTVFMNLV